MLAALFSYVLQGLLRYCEHASSTQGAVVEQIGRGLDLVLDGEEHQLGHEFHGVTGVQCSPASSLFSSLNLRIRSSKTVPIAWLSRPGSRTVSSGFSTGFGLKFTVGDMNRSMRLPSTPPVDNLFLSSPTIPLPPLEWKRHMNGIVPDALTGTSNSMVSVAPGPTTTSTPRLSTVKVWPRPSPVNLSWASCPASTSRVSGLNLKFATAIDKALGDGAAVAVASPAGMLPQLV